MKYQVLLILFTLIPPSYAMADVNSERLGRSLLREHYETVTGGYGPEGHAGIDFRARRPLPVYSPVSGTVSVSDSGNGHFAIEMENGTFFIFLHLSEIYIEAGDVEVGDMIGLTGSTLYNNFPITGPHLHVEARSRSGAPADPNDSNSYSSNVNPGSVVHDPERLRYGYVLAPLVTAADIRINPNGNLVFNIDISSYSHLRDLEFLVSVYDKDDSRIYQGSFDINSAETSVSNRGGGFVTIPADNSRLEQNLISIDGATNSISSSQYTGGMHVRVFVRNSSICRAFDIGSDNCSHTSAFVANIGGTKLGLANSLRTNDSRRIFIDPAIVY